jgi:hypothetical protein
MIIVVTFIDVGNQSMQTIIQKKNANLETVKFNNKYITVPITIKVVSLVCRCSSVYYTVLYTNV